MLFRSAHIIVANGIRKSQAYYANTLAVQMIENYGQVRITDQANGKALPKTYVKVYGKLANGQVRFYKDGYTDLRGKCDYASVSTSDIADAQKFSVLVMSDDNGAMVLEAPVPQR